MLPAMYIIFSNFFDHITFSFFFQITLIIIGHLPTPVIPKHVFIELMKMQLI